MPTPTLEIYNGRYYAIWSDNRRSKRKSMGTAERAVAEQRFAQWLLLGGHKDEAPEGAKAALTVAELWSIYDAKHVQRECAAPASIEYGWKNLSAHFGRLTIDAIDEDAVEAYREKRETGRIGRPSKHSTIRRELGALIACLNWHAAPERGKRKLIDPKDVPLIALPDEGPPRTRWLSSAEMQALLAAAASLHPNEPRMTRGERFLWIALETAARKRAILDLKWDRVDFVTGMIDFAVPGRKQTKKRRPSTPISKALRPVLLRMKEEAINDYVLDHGSDVWSTVQAIVVKAGLAPKLPRGTGERIKSTGISPHTFRHTAATHMVRNGIELYTVAGILGNSLAMVEKVYAKHCPGRLRAAVDAISGGAMESAE